MVIEVDMGAAPVFSAIGVTDHEAREPWVLEHQ